MCCYAVVNLTIARRMKDFVFVVCFFISNAFSSIDLFEELVKENDCHPKVLKSCPLYSVKNRGKRFKISYSQLVDYYNYILPGIILENTEKFVLKKTDGSIFSNQKKQDLTFIVNLRKMRIDPIDDISPDTISKMFKVHIENFTKAVNAENFLEAKRNYYAEKGFNKRSLRFKRDFLLLSDWKSLVHPPVRDLKLSSRETASIDSIDIEFEKSFDEITQSSLSAGNKLKLLVNKVSYDEKIRLINKAKDFVLLAVMTFDHKGESERIITALSEKSKSGIPVYVIVEKVWNKVAFNKTIKRLRKAGVQVGLANDLIKFGKSQGLFHSKYLVVDGKEAINGGQNLVARSHLATGFNHYNKDTDVYSEGPVVTEMVKDFSKLWQRFTKENLDISIFKKSLKLRSYYKKLGYIGSQNHIKWEKDSLKGVCRFLSQGPHGDKFKISKAYLELFRNAANNIIYTSQHIGFKKRKKNSWSTRIHQKLFEKAEEGIKVSLITNGIDGGFLKLGSSSRHGIKARLARIVNGLTGYLNTFLRRSKLDYVSKRENYNIWQHFQYIHSKVALIDEKISVIGSYNFESYSAEHSYETALVCQDVGLAYELKKDLSLDMMNSTPVLNSTQ